MSALKVRQALELALAAITPRIGTEWENKQFEDATGAPGSQQVGVAYQRVTLLLTEPVNDEIGRGGLYREQGFMQVDLFYPLSAGPGDAATRAELIRSTFQRGASFTASGVTVVVSGTPEIRPGRIDEDRYAVPVRIPFYAHIGG